jgi:hypothetical protein
LETGMTALLGECSQVVVIGHDVLNIPNDIVDVFGVEGASAVSADFLF